MRSEILDTRIPPVIIFLLFTGFAWWFRGTSGNNSSGFDFIDILPGFILLAGVTIGLLAVLEFSRKSTTVNPHKPQNTRELVSSCIYKHSRNPMYLGLLLALLAIVIYLENNWLYILLPLFVWYMNKFQIAPEEKALEEKFGSGFQEYRAKVRRWI